MTEGKDLEFSNNIIFVGKDLISKNIFKNSDKLVEEIIKVSNKS